MKATNLLEGKSSKNRTFYSTGWQRLPTTLLTFAACLLAGCAFLPTEDGGDIATATTAASPASSPSRLATTTNSNPDWLLKMEEMERQFFSEENREFREALCADATGQGGMTDYLCRDTAQAAPATPTTAAWTEKEAAALEISLVLVELGGCVIQEGLKEIQEAMNNWGAPEVSQEANARKCLPQFNLGELAETEILRMYRETDECNAGYSGSQDDFQAGLAWGLDCGEAAGERLATRLGWEGLAAVQGSLNLPPVDTTTASIPEACTDIPLTTGTTGDYWVPPLEIQLPAELEEVVAEAAEFWGCYREDWIRHWVSAIHQLLTETKATEDVETPWVETPWAVEDIAKALTGYFDRLAEIQVSPPDDVMEAAGKWNPETCYQPDVDGEACIQDFYLTEFTKYRDE